MLSEEATIAVKRKRSEKQRRKGKIYPFECSLKNDRMISVHFQHQSFNITVIQVYAPTSNTEEAEGEWF